MCGMLSNNSGDMVEEGFLAFLWLICTLYWYTVLYAAIVSLKNAETPQQLYTREKQLPKDMHLQWYNIIRAIVSDRITTEQDRMPSHTSMLRHWFHSCCIAGMWFNSTEEDIQQELPAPELCGWKKNENRTYEYDWECQMVPRHVQDTINFLTIGCGCKKRCQTNTVVDLVAVARTVRIFNSLF